MLNSEGLSKNELKYLNTYNRLMDKFVKNPILKSDLLYTENHHIVPKCMGGTDELSNLVRLPAREHIMAHLLLKEIYPHNPKIVFAANMVFVGGKSDEYRDQSIKTFSSKTIARVREDSVRERSKLISGKNHPLYGKTLSPEYKKKISDSTLGEKNHFFGKKHTEEAKKAIGKSSKERMRREVNPFLGKHLSDETKQKISDSLKGKMSGGKNPRARKIITPDGKIYESISDFRRAEGVGFTKIDKWLKDPNSGYNYLS